MILQDSTKPQIESTQKKIFIFHIDITFRLTNQFECARFENFMFPCVTLFATFAEGPAGSRPVQSLYALYATILGGVQEESCISPG